MTIFCAEPSNKLGHVSSIRHDWKILMCMEETEQLQQGDSDRHNLCSVCICNDTLHAVRLVVIAMRQALHDSFSLSDPLQTNCVTVEKWAEKWIGKRIWLCTSAHGVDWAISLNVNG